MGLIKKKLWYYVLCSIYSIRFGCDRTLILRLTSNCNQIKFDCTALLQAVSFIFKSVNCIKSSNTQYMRFRAFN